MKLRTLLTTLTAICGLAAVTVSTNAAVYVVPGMADPWLANATIDNVGTPEPPDIAPFQSPVLVGSVTPGTTISWTATGLVGHYPTLVDLHGPDGASYSDVRRIGAANGISALPSTPMCSLIGVWAYQGGGGIPFFMGSSGSAEVPDGVSQFFLGTMDSYGWANNVGEFQVTITGVPDAGATAGLMLLGLGLLAFSRKQLRS